MRGVGWQKVRNQLQKYNTSATVFYMCMLVTHCEKNVLVHCWKSGAWVKDFSKDDLK